MDKASQHGAVVQHYLKYQSEIRYNLCVFVCDMADDRGATDGRGARAVGFGEHERIPHDSVSAYIHEQHSCVYTSYRVQNAHRAYMLCTACMDVLLSKYKDQGCTAYGVLGAYSVHRQWKKIAHDSSRSVLSWPLHFWKVYWCYGATYALRGTFRALF